ncbi:MAG: protoglobin domain-containing protein [Myxococcota bacterium]
MEDTFAELKQWMRFTPDDANRLRAVLPQVQPHLHPVIDLFYDEIQRHSTSNSVLEGPAQVERLKVSLRRWLREVFEGPHDANYAARRRKIGHRHVQVGLPDRYMYSAMHLIQAEITDILRDQLDDPDPVVDSLRKVCSMDLALMTGTYVESRERQQFESLQDLLVEHLRLAVLLVDDRGIVRSATHETARLMTGEEVVNRLWQDGLPVGLVRAGSLDEHVKRALAQRVEVTLPRVDVAGSHGTRSYRVHVLPLQHELASFMLQIEELTDALDLEARLRRSESLAQLGALSAAVAHELRNPLAGISGALQVITRSMEEDSQPHQILLKVELEVRRLNLLVTDLLAFARPGSAELYSLPLRPVADEVGAFPAAEHSGITVDVRGEGTARFDPNLLRQILHNLVRNAVDAAKPDGVVRLDVSDGQVRVSDSGTGIPTELRDEIFKPFVTTKTRGTGLGLAISSRAVDAMGGTLKLEEGPLTGASFVVRLSS